MHVFSVEVLNDDAIALLQNLERLNIIRLKEITKKKSTHVDLGKKYAGKISPELADKLSEYVQKSRDE